MSEQDIFSWDRSNMHFSQSRFSLYTEYTHRACLLSKIISFLFRFGIWPTLLKIRMIISYYAVRCHPRYVKLSNYVTWMAYSLLPKTKKTCWKRSEPRKRQCFASAFCERDSRRSETQTNALATSILSSQTPTPNKVLRRAPRSLGSALILVCEPGG